MAGRRIGALAIYVNDIKTAVQKIAPYLEDTSNDAPQNIYFDGWHGLGAPAVLRAIAEQSPQLLGEKFNKIIHIDCSIWKSRRALQRVIVDEVNLTQLLAADFDRQDEEDDFSGVDQGSRAEIRDITRVIGRYLLQYRCLVIFHNGSSSTVDLASFGIPMLEYIGTTVLWTFRGRLCLNRDELLSSIDSSDLALYAYPDSSGHDWNAHLAEDAREIALHTHKLCLGVTPEIATKCFLYLLSLNKQGKKMMDYKWATHASSYWVCDGIIGGQENKTWDVAHALQQQIRLEDYSSNTELTLSVGRLDLSSKQWICITESYFKEVPPETTTLLFAPRESTPRVVSLTRDKFHKADQLRVLKLCGCTFSFSSPPFHCCHNLRFLGLDTCKDELQQVEEEEEKTTCEPAVEIFQRLWVLDVCHTDWPLAFPLETEEQVVAEDIREVHITNGRIWQSNLAWRRLPNLHRLHVVQHTNPCETYEGLPSSLESFSLDAGSDHENGDRISCISLAGCTILSDFILRGSLPNLEELDLSHTTIKILDLGEVVEVQNLRRLFLMGCERLRSISWPKTEMNKLRLLCIDTRAGGEVDNNTKPWSRDCSLMDYQKDQVKDEYFHAYIAVGDVRFFQSLPLLWRGTIRCDKLNLCLSSTTSNYDGRSCHKDKMGRPYYGSEQLAAGALSVPKSLTYHDISIGQISAKVDNHVRSSSSSAQFVPRNLHMEIGEGISDITDKSSRRARDAVYEVMHMVQSLHVHDNSSITTVAPEHIFIGPDGDARRIMNALKWCRVERCPKLDTVFPTNYYWYCFSDLEIFWAAHLLMVRSIWTRQSRDYKMDLDGFSFTKLKAIHLHYCPRLRYVLRVASTNALRVLETLHIHCCGDLRHVFLVEQEFQEKIAAKRHEKGILKFSNLKNLYLYELPNLQQICEAKLFAPKLETIHTRGCWSLRRLPATLSRRHPDGGMDWRDMRRFPYGRPVAVDCEKDWWDKLEWDDMGYVAAHHPSLFEPSHSKYYKRRHLRVSVLR